MMDIGIGLYHTTARTMRSRSLKHCLYASTGYSEVGAQSRRQKCGEKAIQKRDVEIVEFLDELQPHGDTVVKNGMNPWIRLTLIEKQ